jgi:hypothetical protein
VTTLSFATIAARPCAPLTAIPSRGTLRRESIQEAPV